MISTEDDEVRLADRIEAAANRDMYAAAPAAMRLTVKTIGSATALVAPAIPFAYFNRAIGLGVDDAATGDQLDAILACYRAAGVGDFWIHLSPAAQPEALPGWLEARGFTPPARRAWAKFLRGAEPVAPARSDLDIRQAGRGDGEYVGAVVCAAYGMPSTLAPWIAALTGRPGWQVFVATEAQRIVAAGALYIEGGTAWLGIAATLADYRSRGAQSALLAARVAAAAAAGCTALVTETGEPMNDEANPSFANILNAGFRRVASRLNYAAPAGGTPRQ